MTSTTRNVNLASRRERAVAVKSIIGEANSRGNNKHMSNALTSSFKYANQELRDEFYAILRSTGQSISSVVNELLVQWLAEHGVEIELNTNPVRPGRPLGSRNTAQATRRSSSVARQLTPEEYEPVQMVDGLISTKNARALVGRNKPLPPPPTLLEIGLMIKENRAGLFPVGEYHRITPEELVELQQQVYNSDLSREILTAKYVDEVGNYFNAEWWFWFNNKSGFTSNIDGKPTRLASNAIIDGKWRPTDPNDLRITPELRPYLVDEAGNLVENPVIPIPRFNYEHIGQ